MKRIPRSVLGSSSPHCLRQGRQRRGRVLPGAEADCGRPRELPDRRPSAAPPPPPPRRRRRTLTAGPRRVFFRAAQDLDLTDEAEGGHRPSSRSRCARAGPAREMSALHGDLVASVKEGKIDASKIQADEAAVAKSFSAREEEQATALAGLHDALNAGAAEAVADAVRTAAQAARERPASPGGAHGDRVGGPDHDHGDHGGSDHRRGRAWRLRPADWAARRLERMKSQLVLDAEQQKQVTALLAWQTPAPAAAQARMDATKKQTEAPRPPSTRTFDPKKIDCNGRAGHKLTEPFDREVRYLAQLLPIPTAGQRDRLA